MPHREPAVQSFQDLHRRPGIAGAFRTWQQLQGMQLESHRVVLGHLSAVFGAQNLVQAQLRIERPECRLWVSRRDLEAPVESRQELLQHAVGAYRPEFSYQPVLKGSRRSFHPTLGLGRLGEYHLNPQFLHGPAELGRHPREAGAGRVFEDPVPVGVEGDGYAEILHETLDQYEVAWASSRSEKRASTTVPVASSTASSSAKGGRRFPNHG